MQYHSEELEMEYPLTFGQYQQGLDQGKFMGLRCKGCHELTFPPLGVCRKCNGTELEPTDISGKGTIRTFTVIRVAPEGRKPPYVVAMVELEEGPCVIGNLVDIIPDEADISLIGKRVTLGSQMVQGDTYSLGDFRVITFTLTGE
jgi:uncharacterized OB-fold protein